MQVNGRRSPWVTISRPNDGSYWENDHIERLPGIGKVTITYINSINPHLSTIKQLSTTDPDTLSSIRGIHKFISLSKLAMQGDCPFPTVDHRLASNPYQSKYGGEWEHHLKSSAALSPYLCITDLILYMCTECKRLMIGTAHKRSWYFYHDALSQITATDTKLWMRNTNFDGKPIYERWFIPKNDLNIGTRFHERPVGNSPEFMPLDNSLIADLRHSHQHHCAITAHLPDDDVRKHSLSTPKMIERGIRRIWDNDEGPPTSDRIVHDVIQTINAFHIVYEAKGNIVPGLCDRNGHRRKAGQRGTWGGKRQKH